LRIALDATYSVGGSPSGVGVYCREILNATAQSGLADHWDWFFRPKPFWRDRHTALPPNVTRRLLTDTWGNRSALLFHGLNQRLPARRFPQQIATFHDLFVISGEYSTREFRERFTAQSRRAAASADLIIAVSGFTAAQVSGLLNFPESRIRIVHHGVLPRKIPDLPRENIVLSVGAIQKRKNQAALVRAFRALPEDWKLVLAGSPGYGAAEVMDEIAKSPRSQAIRVTGYISEGELAEWYGRATIFAFPSLDEGFGIPVLEAMAAGLPVITSNRSAMPEIAGDAALLVDPSREDEIASALLSLAADTEMRNRLSEAGRLRAGRYTWSRAATQTLAVYRELLNR
jgi:glycosyltransferase involved in cell wall biosynthesis